MTDHAGVIRAAIQALLDEEGDGYIVAQVCIAMGLERINSDGDMESVPWVWSPSDQPHWQSLALLHEATDLQTARIDD